MALLIKTLNGLGYASVKARNGLPVSDIKNINGLDADGGGFDPDAQDYFDRIVVEGGTIGDPEKGYVNTFVLAAKANNYWTELNRINIFVGNYAAIVVPLKIGAGASVDTFVNFVSGDYSQSTGLTAGTGDEHLDTGLLADDLTLNSTHQAFYNRGSTGYTGRHGATDATNIMASYPPYSDGRFYDDQYDSGGGRVDAATGGTPFGFLVAVRRASNDHEIYRNGSSLATSSGTSSGILPNLALFVFAVNSFGSAVNWRQDNLGAYSYGTALSDAQVASYNTDLESLMVSLGRGVQ